MSSSPFEGENLKLWEGGYITIGILILIFAIYYVIKTLKETISNDNNIQGQKSAQVFYIIALFVKSAGLLVAGLMLIAGCTHKTDKDKYSTWDVYSIIPTGFPGYMTAVAYSYIFFSWCSVCYSSLEKNSIGFYHNSKKFLSILIYSIVILFFISFIFMVLSTFPSIDFLVIAHNVESVVASIRDVACAIAFLFYLFKIYKLFESCCPSWESPETRLLVMLMVLIVALFLRPICILTYVLIFNSNNHNYNEFSTGYFYIFVAECFVTELLPLGFIGFIRLTSTQSYSTPADDNVAAFLALD